MTPQEQIAYLRGATQLPLTPLTNDAILAVCDLAERALLDDDEAEAVRDEYEFGASSGRTKAVLRRLLGET